MYVSTYMYAKLWLHLNLGLFANINQNICVTRYAHVQCASVMYFTGITIMSHIFTTQTHTIFKCNTEIQYFGLNLQNTNVQYIGH